MPPNRMSDFFHRLPSFVWIIIFLLGIVVLIGSIIGLFYLLSHVEGFASLIMLLAGWGSMRLMSTPKIASRAQPSPGHNIAVALGIGFFALMGLAIDQTGNVVYNQPLEWFFCPSGTQLERGVVVTNPVPGQTNISQDFSCVKSGEVAHEIGIGKIILVRLGEYILIGYALLWLNRLYNRWRASRSSAME